MAVAHVLTFRYLSKQLPSYQAVLQLRPARYYGLQKKMTKEERHELAEYRRKVTELRKEFLEEWKGKEKMSQEAFSVQAAEVAKMERQIEEQALEDNQKELERMKLWREQKVAERNILDEERRKQGEITRKAVEEQKLQERTAEVQSFIESVSGFITMENLDAKMEEAVETEKNYNYALKQSGEKIWRKII